MRQQPSRSKTTAEPEPTRGNPLPSAVRVALEPRFHHDFSNVRIFDDSEAHQRAESLEAGAYTLGSEIHFAHGHYAPESPGGYALLAHELAHVVQQRDAPLPESPRRTSPGDAVEVDASRAASAALAGEAISPSASDALIACGPQLPLGPGGPGLPPGEIPPELWRMPNIPGETPFRPPMTAPGGPGVGPVTGVGVGTGATAAAAEGVGMGALRYLGPVGAFLATMLYSSPTAPPWMDEINPTTGRGYASEAEYNAVRQMSPEQQQAAREAFRAPGTPAAPASDPLTPDPAIAPGAEVYGPPLNPDWHPPMEDPSAGAPMSAMPTYRNDDDEDEDDATDNRSVRRTRQPQRRGQDQVTDEPATEDGTPGDNRAQNAQMDRAMVVIQQRLGRSFGAEEYARVRGKLHPEVTKQNMGLDGLVKAGMSLLNR